MPATARSADAFDGSSRRDLALCFAPAVKVLWRSPSQLQLELGQRRIVLDGPSVHLLERVLGDRTAADEAVGTAGPDRETRDLLEFLHRAGFLCPAGSARGALDAEWAADRLAFAPDLAALGERFGEHGVDVLRRRRARAVSVVGSGRLPALVSALLAAAGIGRVHPGGDGDVSLWDVIPGGLTHHDEGRRLASAAAHATTRGAPATDTRAVALHEADLVVIAGATPIGATAQTQLLIDGTTHLCASVWGASAVVGPLVVPGVSSCLGCADRHRQDRDPAWPALAVQLAAVRRVPSDVAVCAFAAALTTMQALAYLDGDQPTTINGTLEMSLPDWRIRRRSWPTHGDCACRRWPATAPSMAEVSH